MPLSVCVYVCCVWIPDRASVCASWALSPAPTVRWNAFHCSLHFFSMLLRLHEHPGGTAGREYWNPKAAVRARAWRVHVCVSGFWDMCMCVCVRSACSRMIFYQRSVSKRWDIAVGKLSLSNAPVTRLPPSCCFYRIRDATIAFSLCFRGWLLHSQSDRATHLWFILAQPRFFLIFFIWGNSSSSFACNTLAHLQLTDFVQAVRLITLSQPPASLTIASDCMTNRLISHW